MDQRFITVEPAREQRGSFALWCLAQTPAIQTSSATGFDVPLNLFPSVPAELLVGAYVDGFRMDVSMPQPKAAEPVEAPVQLPFEAEPTHVDPPLTAETATAIKPTRTPRKRARKAPVE